MARLFSIAIIRNYINLKLIVTLKTKLILKIHHFLIISLHFISSYALRLITSPVSVGWKCRMTAGT